MDIFKPFISSFQNQSFGNLGSSNEGLSIEITTIENQGSVSSLSQISAQNKNEPQHLMVFPLHKKKTLPFDQTTISELRLISEKNIDVPKGPTSSKSLQLSQTSIKVSDKLVPQSSPNLPQFRSNPSIKSSTSIESGRSFQKVEVVKKSRYWELLQECQKDNKMFVDEEFPAGDQSMGDANYVKNQQGYAGKWQRISKIVPNAVFVNTFNIEDALQGYINNCYLISSIASVAKDYPNMFDRIFVSNKINPYGIYMARFYAQGILVQVVVDDYVPITTDKKPYYARPSAQNQIWAIVLEKCWAKFFKSYQRTDFGYPQEALYTLTGSPFAVKSFGQASEDKHLKQFLKLCKFQQKGHLFGTYTKKFKKEDALMGLVPSHAYSVVQLISNPICIVKLRNPTGKNANYTTTFWKDRLIKKYGPVEGQKYLDILRKNRHDLEAPLENGIFYMDYYEFMQNFESITYCQVSNEINLLSVRSSFTKNKAKFFYFDLTRESPITISMSQMFKKLTENFKSNDDAVYAVIKLVLAKLTKKNPGSDNESFSDNVSIKVSIPSKESQSKKQSNSKSSLSSVSQMESLKYEFLGARSNANTSALNFLVFTNNTGSNTEDKQIIFEPGRYVIYASANIQKIAKKDFTVTVYNKDSIFPKQINDFAELYSQKTSPLVSVIGSLGIVDSNQRYEKRWLEEVFLNKAHSDKSRMNSLKDYELVRQRMADGKEKEDENGEKVNEFKAVPEKQSWFSCRMPWYSQSQKMAGFGYFVCHITQKHNSIQNFTFEINQYYGRFVEIVTMDEKFSSKEKTYTMSVRPGETRIVVLKVNFDKENFMNVKKQYPLGEKQEMQAPAPLPTRSSVPLTKDKKA